MRRGDQLGRGPAAVQQFAHVRLGAAQQLQGGDALQRLPAGDVEDDGVPGGGGHRLGILAQAAAAEVSPGVVRRVLDGPLLEYDDERSGGFAPLRFLPKGKKVVLGLVSSKFATLESKDALKRRIDEAAKIVPLEQLAISPQCGFSSTAEGNVVSVDDERKKLELCVGVARDVWGGLVN